MTTYEEHFKSLLNDLNKRFPKLVKKYGLSISHSGGGCFHIEMTLGKKNILINPYDKDVEYDVPKTAKTNCIFGVYENNEIIGARGIAIDITGVVHAEDPAEQNDLDRREQYQAEGAGPEVELTEEALLVEQDDRLAEDEYDGAEGDGRPFARQAELFLQERHHRLSHGE